MSDLPGRTSSSLTITERKPQVQKAGGCVGIFFQLFNWNRKFAKKKFFHRKLLPPARTKVSKKFNAEEKLPVTKQLLIADENKSGGFSSKFKKVGGLENKKHEMQAPGLVARLMGLEAMPVPAGKHNKSNEGLPNKKYVEGSDNGLAKAGLTLSPEKGNLRPQKIQKTGLSDRKSNTRFGAEALQIKNVLSRSRKHHHHHHLPKLASPVKCPKVGRNPSRLIDVATRILEPGIQATNRARCSLAYSNSTMEQPWNEGLTSEVNCDLDMETQVSNVQAACRSCGNILKDMDMSCNEGNVRDGCKQVSDFREVFFHGFDKARPIPAVYLENENDVVLLKTRYRPECENSMDNRSPAKGEARNGVHESQYFDHIPLNRKFTSQKNATSSADLKHRTKRHGQMSVGDRVSSKFGMANTEGRIVSSAINPVDESKDFITLNRNLSRNRLRIPTKPDGIEAERRFCTGKNESVATQRSPVRKRTLHDNSPVDKSQLINKGKTVTANTPVTRSALANQTCLRKKPATQRGSKNNDIVSFTFNSPVKTSTGKIGEVGARHKNTKSSVTNGNFQEQLIMEVNAKKNANQNYMQMNEDALGAILEQKLKELSHQVETEAATGFTPSARTTASILQELISALTAERPDSCKDVSSKTDPNYSECDSEVADSVSQANLRNKRPPDGFSREVDHSPGCVLDASFSSESCISSSIIDASGQQATSTDAELLDCASSTNKHGRGVIMMVTSLVNHVSAILHDINHVHSRLSSANFNYFLETLSNAELLFGNVCHSSSSIVDFLLGPFLDELESLVIAAWKNSVILGIEVRKEHNPLRRFLLDCLVECLDLRYTRYSDSGFQVWSELPKSINAEVLIKTFDEEVRKWIGFAGKSSDEIIEKEMSTSSGKWTNFDIEAFETGAEISRNIFQILVDEIVTDLYSSKFSIF